MHCICIWYPEDRRVHEIPLNWSDRCFWDTMLKLGTKAQSATVAANTLIVSQYLLQWANTHLAISLVSHLFFWMLFCILKISWFWLSVLKVLWWNFLVSMNMCVCVNTCPYIYIWSSYYCHPIIVLHLPQWLLQSFLAHLFTGFNCWAKKKC